ncbi:hypothetical protein ACP4OV_029420 [Aristida adscensionis]
MALPTNKSTRALFLVAIVVMAIFLPSSPAAAGGDEKCSNLAGCTIDSCRNVCKSQGFANPVVNCWQQPGSQGYDTCCCFNPVEERSA